MAEDLNLEVKLLAQRVETLETLIKAHIEEDTRQLADINTKLDSILLVIAKYRGVIGGLLLAAGSVGALISYIIHYFKA